MINTAQTKSVGGTDSTQSRDKDQKAESGLFAQELRSKFGNLTTRGEKINASLETLRSMFPKASIRASGSEQSQSRITGQVTAAPDKQVTISEDVLANISVDTEAAEQIRKLIESILGSPEHKNLLSSKEFEGQVWKSVNIQTESAVYSESYHPTNSPTNAEVANIKMQFDYRVSQNFNVLNTLVGGKSKTSSGNTNASAASKGSQAASVFSGAWQASGFFSSSATQYFKNNESTGGGASQGAGMLSQQTQSLSMQIEMQIQQIQASKEGKTDIGMSYNLLVSMLNFVDPLVLDLGGEGIDLKSAEEGVYFDMHGDGVKSKTGFIQGNTALLFLDENGNGVADDIHELFGDSQGHANGFEKLIQYDDNGDGVIDENDEIYSKLRLWRDLNGDGINQKEEAMSLAEAGIATLNLNYSDGKTSDGKGNLIGERSTFTRSNGTQGTLADVWFKTLS